MAQVELKVTTRQTAGKEASRKTRAQGLIPGIIYGKNKKNISISLNPLALKKALTKGGGANTLLTLLEEGTKFFGKKTVIVKDLAKDPVQFQYLHVDFYELDLKQTVTVKVPLHFVGKAEGITQGGIVQPVLREVDVKCLPHTIPAHIEIDVTPLKVGDAFHMSDLKTKFQGKDYEIVFSHDDTVVTVAIPKEEVKKEEAPPPEAAAAAAPGAEGAAAPKAAEGKEAKGAPAKAAPAKEEAPPKKKEEGKK
ncbi:MAG: 50S ribosomal protein L25 [Deltaproteobacteria bacterium]|nr:50S ribosomal protein L25 [Deltaproteobacteria bacterium]